MAKEGKRITAARTKVDKDQLYDAAAAVALTTGLLVALPETTANALQSTLPAVTSSSWQTNGAVRTIVAAGGTVEA